MNDGTPALIARAAERIATRTRPPRRKDERDWPDAMVAQLRQLWADGLTTAEIARRMRMSKNAITGKTGRLKLSARPSPIVRSSWAPEEDATLTRMVTEHAMWRIISQALPGRTVQACKKRVYSLDMDRGVRWRRSSELPELPVRAEPVVRPMPDRERRVAEEPVVARVVPTREGCRFPRWPTGSRPTHEYCNAPVRMRAGVMGPVPDVWCRACAGVVFAGRMG